MAIFAFFVGATVGAILMAFVVGGTR